MISMRNRAVSWILVLTMVFTTLFSNTAMVAATTEVPDADQTVVTETQPAEDADADGIVEEALETETTEAAQTAGSDDSAAGEAADTEADSDAQSDNGAAQVEETYNIDLKIVDFDGNPSDKGSVVFKYEDEHGHEVEVTSEELTEAAEDDDVPDGFDLPAGVEVVMEMTPAEDYYIGYWATYEVDAEGELIDLDIPMTQDDEDDTDYAKARSVTFDTVDKDIMVEVVFDAVESTEGDEDQAGSETVATWATGDGSGTSSDPYIIEQKDSQKFTKATLYAFFNKYWPKTTFKWEYMLWGKFKRTVEGQYYNAADNTFTSDSESGEVELTHNNINIVHVGAMDGNGATHSTEAGYFKALIYYELSATITMPTGNAEDDQVIIKDVYSGTTNNYKSTHKIYAGENNVVIAIKEIANYDAVLTVGGTDVTVPAAENGVHSVTTTIDSSSDTISVSYKPIETKSQVNFTKTGDGTVSGIATGQYAKGSLAIKATPNDNTHYVRSIIVNETEIINTNNFDSSDRSYSYTLAVDGTSEYNVIVSFAQKTWEFNTTNVRVGYNPITGTTAQLTDKSLQANIINAVISIAKINEVEQSLTSDDISIQFYSENKYGDPIFKSDWKDISANETGLWGFAENYANDKTERIKVTWKGNSQYGSLTSDEIEITLYDSRSTATAVGADLAPIMYDGITTYNEEFVYNAINGKTVTTKVTDSDQKVTENVAVTLNGNYEITDIKTAPVQGDTVYAEFEYTVPGTASYQEHIGKARVPITGISYPAQVTLDVADSLDDKGDITVTDDKNNSYFTDSNTEYEEVDSGDPTDESNVTPLTITVDPIEGYIVDSVQVKINGDSKYTNVAGEYKDTVFTGSFNVKNGEIVNGNVVNSTYDILVKYAPYGITVNNPLGTAKLNKNIPFSEQTEEQIKAFKASVHTAIVNQSVCQPGNGYEVTWDENAVIEVGKECEFTVTWTSSDKYPSDSKTKTILIEDGRTTPSIVTTGLVTDIVLEYTGPNSKQTIKNDLITELSSQQDTSGNSIIKLDPSIEGAEIKYELVKRVETEGENGVEVSYESYDYANDTPMPGADAVTAFVKAYFEASGDYADASTIISANVITKSNKSNVTIDLDGTAGKVYFGNNETEVDKTYEKVESTVDGYAITITPNTAYGYVKSAELIETDQYTGEVTDSIDLTTAGSFESYSLKYTAIVKNDKTYALNVEFADRAFEYNQNADLSINMYNIPLAAKVSDETKRAEELVKLKQEIFNKVVVATNKELPYGLTYDALTYTFDSVGSVTGNTLAANLDAAAFEMNIWGTVVGFPAFGESGVGSTETVHLTWAGDNARHPEYKVSAKVTLGESRTTANAEATYTGNTVTVDGTLAELTAEAFWSNYQVLVGESTATIIDATVDETQVPGQDEDKDVTVLLTIAESADYLETDNIEVTVPVKGKVHPAKVTASAVADEETGVTGGSVTIEAADENGAGENLFTTGDVKISATPEDGYYLASLTVQEEVAGSSKSTSIDVTNIGKYLDDETRTFQGEYKVLNGTVSHESVYKIVAVFEEHNINTVTSTKENPISVRYNFNEDPSSDFNKEFLDRVYDATVKAEPPTGLEKTFVHKTLGTDFTNLDVGNNEFVIYWKGNKRYPAVSETVTVIVTGELAEVTVTGTENVEAQPIVVDHVIVDDNNEPVDLTDEAKADIVDAVEQAIVDNIITISVASEPKLTFGEITAFPTQGDTESNRGNATVNLTIASDGKTHKDKEVVVNIPLTTEMRPATVTYPTISEEVGSIDVAYLAQGEAVENAKAIDSGAKLNAGTLIVTITPKEGSGYYLDEVAMNGTSETLGSYSFTKRYEIKDGTNEKITAADYTYYLTATFAQKTLVVNKPTAEEPVYIDYNYGKTLAENDVAGEIFNKVIDKDNSTPAMNNAVEVTLDDFEIYYYAEVDTSSVSMLPSWLQSIIAEVLGGGKWIKLGEPAQTIVRDTTVNLYEFGSNGATEDVYIVWKADGKYPAVGDENTTKTTVTLNESREYATITNNFTGENDVFEFDTHDEILNKMYEEGVITVSPAAEYTVEWSDRDGEAKPDTTLDGDDNVQNAYFKVTSQAHAGALETVEYVSIKVKGKVNPATVTTEADNGVAFSGETAVAGQAGQFTTGTVEFTATPTQEDGIKRYVSGVTVTETVTKTEMVEGAEPRVFETNITEFNEEVANLGNYTENYTFNGEFDVVNGDVVTETVDGVTKTYIINHTYNIVPTYEVRAISLANKGDDGIYSASFLAADGYEGEYKDELHLAIFEEVVAGPDAIKADYSSNMISLKNATKPEIGEANEFEITWSGNARFPTVSETVFVTINDGRNNLNLKDKNIQVRAKTVTAEETTDNKLSAEAVIELAKEAVDASKALVVNGVGEATYTIDPSDNPEIIQGETRYATVHLSVAQGDRYYADEIDIEVPLVGYVKPATLTFIHEGDGSATISNDNGTNTEVITSSANGGTVKVWNAGKLTITATPNANEKFYVDSIKYGVGTATATDSDVTTTPKASADEAEDYVCTSEVDFVDGSNAAADGTGLKVEENPEPQIVIVTFSKRTIEKNSEFVVAYNKYKKPSSELNESVLHNAVVAKVPAGDTNYTVEFYQNGLWGAGAGYTPLNDDEVTITVLGKEVGLGFTNRALFDGAFVDDTEQVIISYAGDDRYPPVSTGTVDITVNDTRDDVVVKFDEAITCEEGEDIAAIKAAVVADNEGEETVTVTRDGDFPAEGTPADVTYKVSVTDNEYHKAVTNYELIVNVTNKIHPIKVIYTDTDKADIIVTKDDDAVETNGEYADGEFVVTVAPKMWDKKHYITGITVNGNTYEVITDGYSKGTYTATVNLPRDEVSVKEYTIAATTAQRTLDSTELYEIKDRGQITYDRVDGLNEEKIEGLRKGMYNALIIDEDEQYAYENATVSILINDEWKTFDENFVDTTNYFATADRVYAKVSFAATDVYPDIAAKGWIIIGYKKGNPTIELDDDFGTVEFDVKSEIIKAVEAEVYENMQSTAARDTIKVDFADETEIPDHYDDGVTTINVKVSVGSNDMYGANTITLTVNVRMKQQPSPIKVENADHGTVKVVIGETTIEEGKETACYAGKLEITATPDKADGYYLATLVVTDMNGNEILTVDENTTAGFDETVYTNNTINTANDNKYTVTATFAKRQIAVNEGAINVPMNLFEDVSTQPEELKKSAFTSIVDLENTSAGLTEEIAEVYVDAKLKWTKVEDSTEAKAVLALIFPKDSLTGTLKVVWPGDDRYPTVETGAVGVTVKENRDPAGLKDATGFTYTTTSPASVLGLVEEDYNTETYNPNNVKVVIEPVDYDKFEKAFKTARTGDTVDVVYTATYEDSAEYLGDTATIAVSVTKIATACHVVCRTNDPEDGQLLVDGKELLVGADKYGLDAKLVPVSVTPAAGLVVEEINVYKGADGAEPVQSAITYSGITGSVTFQGTDDGATYYIDVVYAPAEFQFKDVRQYEFAYGMDDDPATVDVTEGTPDNAQIFRDVVEVPTYTDGDEITVKYLAREAGKYSVNIPKLSAYGVDIYGGGTYEFEMNELWLEPGAEIETVDLYAEIAELEAMFNEIQSAADAAKVAAYAEEFLAELPNKHIGAHEFGELGDGSVEKLMLTYSGDKYIIGETQTDVTIVDNRADTVIAGHDGAVTYGATEADIYEALGLAVTSGGQDIGVKAEIAMNVDSLDASANPYIITVKYAGDKNHQPAQAEFQLTVNKAPCTVDFDSQIVTWGDEYTFEAVTSPAGIDTVDFMIGLDVSQLSEENLVPVGYIQIHLPGLLGRMYEGETTLAEFIETLEALAEQTDSVLIAMGIDPETLDTVVNTLNSFKADLGAVGGTKLVINGEMKPDNIGIYLAGAVTANSNYETAFTVDYLVVVPDATKADLKYNVNDDNGFITAPLIEDGIYDMGATAYVDGEVDQDATDLIQHLFIRADFEGNITPIHAESNSAIDTAVLAETGVYSQLSYIADWGNELYYAMPLVRAYTVIHELVDVDFINEEGEKQNAYTYIYDAEEQPLQVRVTDMAGEVMEVGEELTVTYVGYSLENPTEIYNSTEAPVNAGTYTVTAVYKDDANKIYGMSVAKLVILPARADLDIDSFVGPYSDDFRFADQIKSVAYNEGVADVPEYVAIVRGVEGEGYLSVDRVDFVNGVVVVDLPDRIDEQLQKVEALAPLYAAEGVDLVDLAIYEEGIQKVLDKLQIDASVSEQIMAQLAAAQEAGDVKFIFAEVEDVNPVNMGTYLMTAVTCDANFQPAIGAGLISIHSENPDALIVYNDEIVDGVLELDQVEGFDFGAYIQDNDNALEDEVFNITHLFTGVTEDGQPYMSDKAPTELGSYTQLSVTNDVANRIYIESAARSFEIQKITTNIDIAVEDQQCGTAPIASATIFDREGRELEGDAPVLKVVYSGTGDTEYEATEVAPTAVGTYAVTVTYDGSDIYKAAEAVAEFAIEHVVAVDAAVTPTCEGTGLTEGSHCSVCHKVLVPQEVVTENGHKEGAVVVENEVAATCEDAGSYDNVIYCTVCDKELSRETVTVDALGHSYKAVVTAPTCEAEGYTTYTCECGDSYKADETLPLGHKWDDGITTKLPTCEKEGVVTYTCQNDGKHTYTETIKATGHINLTKTDAKAATHSAEGNIEYYTCECGKLFADADATKEITAADTVIAKIAHSYKAVVTAPTCTEKGYTTYTCECGDSYKADYVNALDHNYKGTVTTEPTCETEGVKTFVCKNDATHTYTETVPTTGHINLTKVEAKAATHSAEGNIEYYTCECGKLFADADATKEITAADIVVAKIAHSYEAVVTAPTCTEKGYTTYTCECGDSYKADYVNALDHNYKGTVTTEPTCETEGVKTFVCQNDKSHTYTEAIKATGHINLTKTDAKAATHSAEGNIEYYTCECGKLFADADATKEITAADIVVAKIAHSYGDWTVTTAPTCTEKGYTTYTCECGDSYKADYVNALDHNYEGEVTTEPTCETEGVKTFVCQNDKSHTYTEAIKATGHINLTKTDAKAATHSAEGNIEYYTCECGKLFADADATKEITAADIVVAKIAHSYGDWTVTTAPTCTAEGEETRTCACGEEQTRPVEKLAHSYNAVVTEPTCTAGGYTTYTCDCGDSYVADETEKLGHSYGEWTVTTEPTCTSEGEETRKCACGEEETRTVAKLSHKAAEPVKEKIVEATCTKAGAYDEVVYCEVGGEELSRETVTVDALGHDKVSHEAKAPTCEGIGWDAYETCTRCDHTTYVEKAALGHTEVIDEAVAPTCEDTGLTEGSHCSVCHKVLVAQEVVTENGHTPGEAPTCVTPQTCKVCNAELKPATGHINLTKVEAKAATHTAMGNIEYYKCECGKLFKDAAGQHRITKAQTIISVKPHAYKATVTAPTCEAEGYTTYTCACGDSYKADETLPLGHKWDDGNTTKLPTCDKGGVVTYTCQNDGKHTYTEVIKATGHTAVIDKAVAPTCTETGLTEGSHCSECHKVLVPQEVVTKNGHTPGEAATCVTAQTCTVCNAELKPATGHSHKAVVTAPTCEAKGYTTYTCACGDSYKADYVDALGHSYEWTVVTEPTVDADGMKQQICKVCGAKGDTETITVSAALKEADKAMDAVVEIDEVTADNLTDARAAAEAARAAWDALTPEEQNALGLEVLKELVELELLVTEVEFNIAKEIAAIEKDFADKKADYDDIERALRITESFAKNVKATSDKAHVSVTWEHPEIIWKGEVITPDAYRLTLIQNGGKKLKTVVVDASVTTYTFKNLLRGTSYRVRVTPVGQYEDRNFYSHYSVSNWVKAPLQKATLTVKKSGANRVIKSADQNSTGFQIWISKDKKFKKGVTKMTVNTNKKGLSKVVSAKKFKKGKNYIKVRAYSVVNGKKVYGAWSKTVTVKK